MGVLELGDSAWWGVGEHFGVTLERQVLNVTGKLAGAASSSDADEALTDGALDSLEELNAADAIVYDYALERAGVGSREERTRLKDPCVCGTAVRLGDLCGPSAVKAAEYDMIAAALREHELELRRKDEELASV